MNNNKRILLTSFLFALVQFVSAQTTAVPTTDVMRSNGKIYVVMAVVVTILVGFFIYLYSVDKKITKLEKSIKN